MIHNITCSLIIYVLYGCGIMNPLKDIIEKDGKPPVIRTTDPVFYEYLNELPFDMFKTPIVFGDIKTKNTVGECTKWSSGYRQITIDKKYWTLSGRLIRLELLAHEIGHCDFNLDHNDADFIDPNGKACPISVMNSVNFGGQCFEDNFDYYMELF